MYLSLYQGIIQGNKIIDRWGWGGGKESEVKEKQKQMLLLTHY